MTYASTFSARIVNIWNSHPNSIVDASTVNAFKARLDKFWLHQADTSEKYKIRGCGVYCLEWCNGSAIPTESYWISIRRLHYCSLDSLTARTKSRNVYQRYNWC